MSNIQIMTLEPWRGHFGSKHRDALELACPGHNVLFHGPPEDGLIWIESVASERDVSCTC